MNLAASRAESTLSAAKTVSTKGNWATDAAAKVVRRGITGSDILQSRRPAQKRPDNGGGCAPTYKPGRPTPGPQPREHIVNSTRTAKKLVFGTVCAVVVTTAGATAVHTEQPIPRPATSSARVVRQRLSLQTALYAHIFETPAHTCPDWHSAPARRLLRRTGGDRSRRTRYTRRHRHARWTRYIGGDQRHLDVHRAPVVRPHHTCAPDGTDQRPVANRQSARSWHLRARHDQFRIVLADRGLPGPCRSRRRYWSATACCRAKTAAC